MQITYHQKHLSLSQRQQDYIEKKLRTLKKFKVLADDSVQVRVDAEYLDSKTSDTSIEMKVTMSVPKTTLRAESKAITIEAGIDLIEEKLRKQLRKYKEKH